MGTDALTCANTRDGMGTGTGLVTQFQNTQALNHPIQNSGTLYTVASESQGHQIDFEHAASNDKLQKNTSRELYPHI